MGRPLPGFITNPERNWRRVLKLYISHVMDQEGVAFLQDFYRTIKSDDPAGLFTDEEWRMVQSVWEEIMEEDKAKACE